MFMRILIALLVSSSFLLAPYQAHAFSMSISPARKTYELSRGDVREFEISFVNQAESTEYRVDVYDFIYEASGSTKTVAPEQLSDPSQSLTSWVTVDETFQARKGEVNKVKVRVEVPQFASYGDHYGMLVFKKATSGDGAVLAVQGGISAILFLKVLGGEEVKSGELESYEVISQQRARNPVNFVAEYKNTGNQFFKVLAEVSVYENKGDQTPIKVVKNDFISYPNVVTPIKIALGDLGDDYGERSYYSELNIHEFTNNVKGKVLASYSSRFDYYLPYTGDEPIPETVQKEVVVTPPLVDVVKELGLYIGGFILLLIILIRVLFFSGNVQRKK